MSDIYLRFFKRLFDFILVFIALIMLFPLFIIIIFISFWMPDFESVFFLQPRVGLNEKVFSIFKFRSMNDKLGDDGKLLPDNLRLTSWGAFLRRYKIDELPQLINVLIGDMAIVGPRPCLPSMKDRFGRYGSHRFHLRPGLTSLAAVKGSVYLDWEKKGIYDYLYVRRASLALDLFIIMKTVVVIFIGEKKLFNKQKCHGD